MTDILVAGLDCRSLLLEAPVLQRQLGSLEEKATVRDLLDTLAGTAAAASSWGACFPTRASTTRSRRSAPCPPPATVSILVVLGSDERAAVEAAALDAGANAVLRRPLDSGKLEDWVAKLLVVPRRVDARVPVQGQVVGTPRHRATGHFYGLSRNLSVNGMLLASPVRLPEAPDLDLEFQLPDAARACAPSAAWCGKPGGGLALHRLRGRVPVRARREPDGHRPASRPRTAPPRAASSGEGRGVLATVRRGTWIYEIVQPGLRGRVPGRDPSRSPRGLAPGGGGTLLVVEAASADAAVRAARAFVNRQE